MSEIFIRLRKLFFLIALMLFGSIGLYAKTTQGAAEKLFGANVQQQLTVDGKVTEKKTGEPIVGATVMVKGTTTGTVTDINGTFSLQVQQEKVLLSVSFIGYETVEIVANNSSSVSVVLEESNIGMNEVIVVGYGMQKKQDLSSAISSISAKDLKGNPAISTDALLQGKASGVQVMSNTGAPGSSVSVKVRGIVTTGNSEPLYVIDGMPMATGGGDNKYGINSLNPSDIESIQILKDASSAAIYGSRGSNGVVLVTTKRGKIGKPVVNFDSHYGWQTMANKVDVLNKEQFKQFYDRQSRKSVDFADFNDAEQFAQLPDFDWQDEIFRTSPMNNAQLSVSGGNENSKFMISFGTTKQDGIVKNSDFSRINFRVNSDHTINKWVRIGESFSISSSSRHRIREGGVGYDFISASPIVTALLSDPTTSAYNSVGDIQPMLHTKTFNGAGLRDRSNYLYNNKKFNGNIYLEIDLFEGLTFKSNLGADFNLGEVKEFSPSFKVPESTVNEGALASELKQQSDQVIYYVWENTATYTKTFKKHQLNFLAGTTVEVNTFQNLGGYSASISGNFPYQQYLDAGNPSDPLRKTWGGASEWRMYSYFGRVNYNFDDRYLFTGSIRQDASSRFGPNKRKGVFPAFSAAWKINNESFLKEMDWIYLAKFRFGWGQVGNQNNIGNYSFNTTLAPNANYPFGLQKVAVPGVSAGVLGKLYDPTTGGKPGNKSLTWETTQTTNIGFDAAFLDNAINFTVDWFYKDNIGMLMESTVPGYLGIIGPDINGGKIVNQGWEFEAGYRKYEGQFTYDVSVNLTTIKTKVVELDKPKFSNNVGDAASRTLQGGGIADFWGYKTDGLFMTNEELAKGPFQQNARVGDVRFKDIDRDGIITNNDQTVLGSPLPKFTYGLTSNFYYKDFDLNIFVQGVQGNKIYNNLYRVMMGKWGTNKHPDILQSWSPENPDTDIPRFIETSQNNNERLLSDRWLEDGSFLRIKTISLGYNLSNMIGNKKAIQNLRVYFTVQNPYTFTNYRGYDPEIAEGVDWGKGGLDMGVDNGNYPQPRTFIVGFNVSF
jgi:TonB-linked SusC/RagA family outer membrane protein